MLPDGLEVGAVLEREDPRDALVLPTYRSREVRPQSKRRDRARQAPASVPAACAASRSCERCSRMRRSRMSAATSTPGCGSSTRATTICSCSRRPACGGWASPRGFRGRAGRRVRAGAGTGHHRRRDSRATTPRRGRPSRASTTGTRRAALEAERALVLGLGGGCQMPIGGIAVPAGAQRPRAARRLSRHSTARAPSAIRRLASETDAGGARPRGGRRSCCERGAADILSEATQNESLMPDPESLRLT